MPFKGPVLAQLAYPDPALRGFSDLDILIAETDVPAAMALTWSTRGPVTNGLARCLYIVFLTLGLKVDILTTSAPVFWVLPLGAAITVEAPRDLAGEPVGDLLIEAGPLRGTTIGGIILGLKLVRLDDRPMGWTTSVVRALSCFLSLVVAFLGFIWIAFDAEKQAWHDKIAGTIVVRSPRGLSLI